MFSGELAKCGSITDRVLGSLDLYAELRVGDLLSLANIQSMEKLLAYKAEVWPNRLAVKYVVILYDRAISLQITLWYLDASSDWDRGTANRMLFLHSLIMTVEDCCLGVVVTKSHPEYLQELQRRSLSERQGSSSHSAQEYYSLAKGKYFHIFKPYSISPSLEKIRCSM